MHMNKNIAPLKLHICSLAVFLMKEFTLWNKNTNKNQYTD